MDEEKKEKIMPCPFCGSIDVHYDDHIFDYYGLDLPGVTCFGCDTRNFGDTKKEAIENWNRRTGGSCKKCFNLIRLIAHMLARGKS